MPSNNDPDASPETLNEAPSPSSPPESTPVEGGTTAPPADSGKDTPKEETPSVPLLGEGDVLDRLTNPKQKTNTQEPEAKEETPAAKEPVAETEHAEESEDEDFKPADETELAGYHSKTRNRIKGFQREIDRLKPSAEFTNELLGEATQLGLSVESVRGWQNLGFGIRKGDPQALAALAEVLGSHGITQSAAPDVTPLRETIEKLHRSMNIDDDAKEAMEKALESMGKPTAPQRQAPPPAQQPRPQEPLNAPYEQTVSWVRNVEAQDAKKFGAKYPEVNKAIYAEAKRREVGLPLNQLNDPVEMRVRYAACREAVLAKLLARPPQPKVESSLRGSGPPTPLKVPQRGTEEYDDYIMTHGIPESR